MPLLTDLGKNCVVAHGTDSIRTYLERTNRNLRSSPASKVSIFVTYLKLDGKKGMQFTKERIQGLPRDTPTYKNYTCVVMNTLIVC